MAFKPATGPYAGLWIFEGTISSITMRAIRFVCGKRAVWLPRGKVHVDETRTGVEVAMPEWLAREKGLL